VGVVLMVDIRRQLTDLDRQLLGWIPPDIALIIVMTKADKLGRQQARQAMRQVAEDPLLANRQAGLLVLLFSTLNRTGVEDLQRAVESLLTGTEVDWAAIARQPGETAPIFKAPPSPQRLPESAEPAMQAASPARPGQRAVTDDPALRFDTGGTPQ
jgi:hypothetical protein